MAQNVTIAGAQYSDVPGIEVPKTNSSGNALFLDAENYRTAAAQDVIDATKADKPSIKTSMDSVAAVNTMYFLGTQSAVSIVLPSGASTGDQLSVVWYNGATAATLSITGTVLAVDYTPSANSRSEVNALWDGTYWAVVTNEQAVSV